MGDALLDEDSGKSGDRAGLPGLGVSLVQTAKRIDVAVAALADSVGT